MEKKQNQLLVRSEIGQVKQTCHDLPTTSHIYGKKSQPDAFGAGALLSSWNQFEKQEISIKERDFSKMNKMCIQQKIVKGKDVIAFRQENTNLMLAPKMFDRKPKGVELSFGACYGKANRPSTPVKGVISGDYASQAEQERNEIANTMRRNKSQVRAKPTKAVELARVEAMKRQAVPTQSTVDCFKMKKFSAVQSRVNTNRGRPDSNCVTPAANEAEKQEISAE